MNRILVLLAVGIAGCGSQTSSVEGTPPGAPSVPGAVEPPKPAEEVVADDQVPVDIPTPPALPVDSTLLVAGSTFTCAAHGSALTCWGASAKGQVGSGATTDLLAPMAVTDFANGAVALSSGIDHACAVTTLGVVRCWGENTYAQLGHTVVGTSSTPVTVQGIQSGAEAVATGQYHSCALVSGSVKCWGDSYFGQLGAGMTTSSRSAIDVLGVGSDIIAVSAHLGNHTCALTKAGGVRCWGANGSGQLGIGSIGAKGEPSFVAGLSNGVRAIAAGAAHSCALTTSGAVKCWGGNTFGALGNATTVDAPLPVDVVGLSSGVIAIASGLQHSCALTNAGGVKCWGANGGRLGNGGNEISVSDPVDVVGLSSGVVAIAAGADHTCARMKTDGVKCWGGNVRGQLGNGTTTASKIPVDVTFP